MAGVKDRLLVGYAAAAGVWTITLPIATVSETNQRGNWRNHRRRHDAQRKTAAMLMQASTPAPLRGANAIAAVQLTRIGGNPLDVGNLAGALKHVQDGVADALQIDDGDPRIAWDYYQKPQPLGTGKRSVMKTSVVVEVAERSRKREVGSRNE